MQNTSHAVMSQRIESKESLDDFPTPPWATRGFLEHILGGHSELGSLHCLEPACNRGYMAQPLSEYFSTVEASDVYNYGYGKTEDFLTSNRLQNSTDWVITNPPFKSAESFALEGLRVAKRGVAMLVRTVFIESVGRYERLFSRYPPTLFAQYVERVPMVKGRLDKKASTATGYGWVVWDKSSVNVETKLRWIPPCRRLYEDSRDYPDAQQQDLFKEF